jgi:ribose 5-phosphate isomerase A
MLSQAGIKKNVGSSAAKLVEDGMRIGVGSGTTVYFFIEELGKRVASGLQVLAVPTSIDSKQLCQQQQIPLADLDDVDLLDLAVDGADEIDPDWHLIKGGGGALLQEKMVASNSRQFVVIADQSKLVPFLGRFPLPVEVIPFGYRHVADKISRIDGCGKIDIRKKDGEIFLSDHGHYILDCGFDRLNDPVLTDSLLHAIPGVVETGLFNGMAGMIMIGYADGSVKKYTKMGAGFR